MATAQKSVEDLFAELEALKRQLDNKKPEIIADIKKKIEMFGIQPDELFTTYHLPVSKQQQNKGDKEKATVKPKYRHPEGQTWSGRGVAPKWMLDEQGKRKEEYAITE